jgi:hypothetical protein
LKIPVVTACPRKYTVRGSPTLREITLAMSSVETLTYDIRLKRQDRAAAKYMHQSHFNIQYGKL